jgi:hypothetical protein
MVDFPHLSEGESADEATGNHSATFQTGEQK